MVASGDGWGAGGQLDRVGTSGAQARGRNDTRQLLVTPSRLMAYQRPVRSLAGVFRRGLRPRAINAMLRPPVSRAIADAILIIASRAMLRDAASARSAEGAAACRARRRGRALECGSRAQPVMTAARSEISNSTPREAVSEHCISTIGGGRSSSTKRKILCCKPRRKRRVEFADGREPGAAAEPGAGSARAIVSACRAGL